MITALEAKAFIAAEAPVIIDVRDSADVANGIAGAVNIPLGSLVTAWEDRACVQQQCQIVLFGTPLRLPREIQKELERDLHMAQVRTRWGAWRSELDIFRCTEMWRRHFWALRGRVTHLARRPSHPSATGVCCGRGLHPRGAGEGERAGEDPEGHFLRAPGAQGPEEFPDPGPRSRPGGGAK